MADKYASGQPELTRKERAVNIMQARMPWSEAELYAHELDLRGVLESGDKVVAVAIFTERMPRPRATSVVNDLIMYGAMENTRRGEDT
jgi:hypothetical protein